MRNSSMKHIFALGLGLTLSWFAVGPAAAQGIAPAPADCARIAGNQQRLQCFDQAYRQGAGAATVSPYAPNYSAYGQQPRPQYPSAQYPSGQYPSTQYPSTQYPYARNPYGQYAPPPPPPVPGTPPAYSPYAPYPPPAAPQPTRPAYAPYGQPAAPGVITATPRPAYTGPPETPDMRQARAVEEFGIPLPKSQRNVKALRGHIVKHRTTGYGKSILTLANGQVWHQVDTGRPLRFRDSDVNLEVIIKRALLGSFKMTVASLGRTIRVKRVK